MKTKLYLYRCKNGTLFASLAKMRKNETTGEWENDNDIIKFTFLTDKESYWNNIVFIRDYEYQEVTWENSPKELIIKQNKLLNIFKIKQK